MDEVIQRIKSKIEHPVTNESLRAIIHGLDIQSGDRVLSILGSGEQALAMLEHGASVKAVDTNEYQMQFFKRKAEALAASEEDYISLMATLSSPGFRWTEMMCNKGYFLERDRLAIIRANLGNLTVELGDIFGVASSEKGFSKVYLSNAIGYRNPNDTERRDDFEYHAPNVPKLLKRASRNLPEGGLVYVTNSGGIYRADQNGRAYLALPKGLQPDKELTGCARAYQETWEPIVLRKVNREN